MPNRIHKGIVDIFKWKYLIVSYPVGLSKALDKVPVEKHHHISICESALRFVVTSLAELVKCDNNFSMPLIVRSGILPGFDPGPQVLLIYNRDLDFF